MVIPYSPAPARIANQIYAQATLPKMIAECTAQGQTVAQAIDWAADELERLQPHLIASRDVSPGPARE